MMVAHLLLNVLLALIWCFLVGDFRAATMVVGYLIGAGVMLLLRRMLGAEVFFRKLRIAVKLAAVFLREMVVANWQVAWWIVRPRLRVQPALIRLPIRLQTDPAITTLAGMISLTPGTLTVDVASDRKSLEIHCLNVPDITATKRQIKEQFEDPLWELEQ